MAEFSRIKQPEDSAQACSGEAADLWQDGWYRAAEACPSPNFGPRPAGISISLAVLHSISLPPGEYGSEHVRQLFLNQLDWDAHPYFQQIRGLQVSAHFFVRRDGSVLQFVSCNARAWHAGASSHKGRDNCNDYSIGIELEGYEGGVFEAAQYEALRPLLAALRSHYGITDIYGHEHVAPGRKTDPGPGFEWQQLLREPALAGLDFPQPA